MRSESDGHGNQTAAASGGAGDDRVRLDGDRAISPWTGVAGFDIVEESRDGPCRSVRRPSSLVPWASRSSTPAAAAMGRAAGPPGSAPGRFVAVTDDDERRHVDFVETVLDVGARHEGVPMRPGRGRVSLYPRT